ncbi:hypothetical protein [Streptomyces sp. G45]|uniref:hypothetical protein n=1 Tax=Streptomyces sp. G45 TaxID=3406627 RepID=UPI003C17ECB2
MPRPTVAQLSYGAATVVCSTVAMLLLSQATSPPGVAVIAVAALGLGLLVAWTVPLPKEEAEPTRPAPATAAARAEAAPQEERIPAQRAVIASAPLPDSVHRPVREPAGP